MKNTDGEKIFPIYSFEFHWTEVGNSLYEGTRLPYGRMKNSAFFEKMFRIRRSEKQLMSFAINWWEKFILKKKKDSDRRSIIDPSDLSFNIKYVEHETWFLTWFQHETFDVGQTDEETLRSFEKFVARKQAINREHNRMTGKRDGKYCLMGAEDRWRWTGAGTTGEREDESPPPCRCVHCREQRVLRIGH